MTGIWKESSGYLQCFIRLTSKKYADCFVQHGQIKMNTPLSWVNEEAKPGKRGDRFEGVLGVCPIDQKEDARKMREHYEQFNPVQEEIIDRYIVFRSIRNMQLPCFCFYMLQFSAFSNQGDWSVDSIHEHSMLPEYFKDFAEYKTKEEVAKLPKCDHQSIIIFDSKAFLERFEKHLLTLGVKAEEIIFSNVRYVEKFQQKAAGVPDYYVPKELYYKDNSYSHQMEGRIVVNTDDSSVLNKLKDPICIGPLNDIANSFDEYLPNGLTVSISPNK